MWVNFGLWLTGNSVTATLNAWHFILLLLISSMGFVTKEGFHSLNTDEICIRTCGLADVLPHGILP